MVQTALRCSGINLGGVKCGNMTTNPSGLCSKHEKSRNPLNQNLVPMSSLDALRPVSSSSGNLKSDSWKRAMDSRVNLRDEQLEVADKTFDAFVNQGKDRVQVRAACGMGKTMMEQAALLKYDEHLQEEEGRTGNYLFVVPTVALANQMANDLLNDGIIQGLDYDENSSDRSDILIVHNESKQFAGTPDKSDSHNRIVSDFMERESDTPKIVITVVNSIDKVISGQNSSDQKFDISFFDEAHNYSGEIDGDPKDPNKRGVLPIYFNDQKDSLQSDNRMFLTATPKMKSKGSATGYESKGIKQDIVNMSNKKSKLDISFYQDGNSPEVFGEHVGNWGYQHAINKKYLTKADFMSNTIMAYGSNRNETLDIERKTKVDSLGNVSKDPNDLSFGSYISMRSIADTVANQGSRNVLSFLNSIEECKESKRNWEQYLLDLSEMKNGRKFQNDDEARMSIISGNDNQRMAGKYFLMAKHSSVTFSSSTSSEKEKEEALNFFDKDEIGDRAQCTCEKPGGWCACARIVHNVDMFSEGVSIKSIDTVVLNRPRYSSDANINQAIGRASRKMEGKQTGKVIIPRGVSQISGERDDSNPWASPLDDKAYVKTLGSINRIWNDLDGNYINDDQRPLHQYGESPILHDVTTDRVPAFYRGDTGKMTDESYRITNSWFGDESGNAIVVMVWEKALNKASSEWNKNHDEGSRFSDLPRSQRESLAKAKRDELYNDFHKEFRGDQFNQAMNIFDYSDMAQYESAKTYLNDNEVRAKAGEFGPNMYHESESILVGKAKLRAPSRIPENSMNTKTGFMKSQWDDVYDRMFA